MDDLRIGKTARELDVTSPTVRNWIKAFPEFLSDSATRQNRKRFTPQDIATLKEIKALLREGFKYSEIPERMPVIPDIIEIEPDYQPQEQPSQTPQNAIAPVEFFNHIAAMLDNQAEQHKREIAAKDETIDLLKTELERARVPWYKRIF